MACSSSNHRVFMSPEVGIGSDGEERVIVQYLEHAPNVGPSAPRTEEERVIDIDAPHFKTAPSSPYVGEALNYSGLKVDGVGPRGGPGGGGESPVVGGPDVDTDSHSLRNAINKKRGDGLDLKELYKALKRLAKTSIFIAAQTGTALLFIPGSTPKSTLYPIAVISVFSYVFCLFSFLVKESKPLFGAIISGSGSLLAALGFLLTMCVIIPPEFIYLFAISTTILFFSLLVFSLY